MRLTLVTIFTLLLAPALLPLATAIQGPPRPTPIPPPPDVAAPPKDAVTTPSGLASKVLTPGTGTAKPGATDMVTVHYTGWTTDGKMFDSSVMRERPATFALGRVVPGWTEGVQLMVEGDKYRFWVPEALAYQGKPGRPAGMLVFDIELVKILPAAPQLKLDKRPGKVDAKVTGKPKAAAGEDATK